jgi:hypothetical protein
LARYYISARLKVRVEVLWLTKPSFLTTYFVN